MKNKSISGNKAAPPNTQPSSPCEKANTPTVPSLPGHRSGQLEFSYVNSPPVPIEPLLTKKTLAEHYGLSIRTINYALTLGLPKVQLGAQVRFRMSEVQPWFEKNGSRRFAAEGIKLAIQKSLIKQYHLNLSDQVQITVTEPKKTTANKKKEDNL